MCSTYSNIYFRILNAANLNAGIINAPQFSITSFIARQEGEKKKRPQWGNLFLKVTFIMAEIISPGYQRSTSLFWLNIILTCHDYKTTFPQSSFCG